MRAKSLLTARRLWLGLTAWMIAYCGLILIPYDVAFALLSGLCLAGAGGVLVAYSEGIRRALVEERVDDADHLILGIGCTMLSIVCGGALAIALRVYDFAPELRNLPLALLFLEMRFTGTLLHMTAPQVMKGGTIPHKQWAYAGKVTAAGLGLAVVIFVLGLSWDGSIVPPLKRDSLPRQFEAPPLAYSNPYGLTYPANWAM